MFLFQAVHALHVIYLFLLFPSSPRDGQSRSSVRPTANPPISGWGEAQCAQHCNRHYINTAHDATATSSSQSAAACPPPRTAPAATGPAPAAAPRQPSHRAFCTAQHGRS